MEARAATRKGEPFAQRFFASDYGVLRLSSEIYQLVAMVGEIPEGAAMAVEINERMIAIFHQEGQYYAMADSCPHAGAPLSDGMLCDKTITCSQHGWRFSLEDGKWLDSPRTSVPTYPVRVVGDRIEVAVPE